MNIIDWSKHGGYPLIENTMDFMQSELIRMLFGLSRALKLSNTSSVCILSGCELSFPAVGYVAVSEGIISWSDGEPLYVKSTPTPLPSNVPLYFQKVTHADSTLDPTAMEDGMNTYDLHENRYAIITTTSGPNTAPFNTQLSFSAMVRNESMPLASVIAYAGTTPPPNWAFCEGQILNRIANPEYQALFDVIGGIYGTGPTTGDFKLPNINNGRFIMGGNLIGSTAGNTNITLNVDNLPAHTHSISDSGEHKHSFADNDIAMDSGTGHNTGAGIGGIEFGFQTPSDTNLAGNHNHGGVTGSTGNGTPINILNPHIVLRYIIRIL